jgi:hypothetical protein
MSDDNFDPDKFLAEEPEQEAFDPDAFLATEEASTPEPIVDVPAEALKTAAGTVAGGLGGYALDTGAKKFGNVAMSVVGDLDSKTIDKISDNREVYKALPKHNPLESMLEQFRGLADSNRQGGLKAAADARKSLEGQSPIPVTEVYQTLAKPAENPKYSNPLAPDKANQLLGEELDRMYPTLEDKQFAMSQVDDQISQIDQELTNPSTNQRQAINQAAKEAKFENKLQTLEPKLNVQGQNTDVVDKAGDTFKDKKEARQILRLDEKIAKTEVKVQKRLAPLERLEDLQKKKEDLLYNSKNAKTKDGTVREVRNQKQFDAAQNQKKQLELNKIIDDEKQARLQLEAEIKKKERLLDQKKSLETKRERLVTKVQNNLNKAAEKADSSLQNIKQAPAEIRSVSPFLQERVLGDDYAASLEDSIADIRNSETIDPVRLDQKLQEIRDNVPEGKTNTVGKFNAELSTAVKNDLQERFPDYKMGMEKSANSFKTEALFDKLGISYNKDLDRVTLENSGRSRLNQILLNPEKYKEEYAYLEEALEDSEMNNLINDVPETLNRAEVSALKGDVERLKQGKELNAFDINSIAKGEYSRAPGIGSKLGGTKLQEAYALFKDSKLANALGKFSKVGMTGGGMLLGGMLGAEAAVDNQDSSSLIPVLDQAESAGQSAAEELQMLKEYQARKNYDKSPAKRDKMAFNEDFKAFVDQKPESINELLNEFSQSPDTQAFVAPLEKAAQGDDRTRSAVLFGLYQQPAFRQALQKKKGFNIKPM